MAIKHNRPYSDSVTKTAAKRLTNPLVILAIIIPSCLGACTEAPGTDSRIDAIIDSYHFSISGWEVEAISREFDDWLFSRDIDIREDSFLVIEYFQNRQRTGTLEAWLIAAGDGIIEGDIAAWQEEYSALEQRNGEILPLVEKVITAQTEDVLRELGLINPIEIASSVGFFFPPVNFVIQPPPHLLVISPRDEITRLKDITLVQIIDEKDKEEIEDRIGRLGLSALVVRLGGIATYPAFVSDNLSLSSTLDVIVEEWFHQFMFFRPLGFFYGLHVAGIKPDYEIATANEALAGIVSREIAEKVKEKYYPQLLSAGSTSVQANGEEFDYYEEMRSIRLHVDELLGQGRVEEAENYMEQKRLFLSSKGYIIRKINQAFFAFYGTYADSPGSISPIGTGLKALREQSNSLLEFVTSVSSMTGVEDIIAAAP
ncbi:MAG: hypothetical protein JW954_00745 [Dehalococcoidaceae bacterium]|nr:hypothetical protein [Dehalococcoidaceae bacterium]